MTRIYIPEIIGEPQPAGQVVVEEALLRDPGLWVPGKKPVGPVKIDPTVLSSQPDTGVLFQNSLTRCIGKDLKLESTGTELSLGTLGRNYGAVFTGGSGHSTSYILPNPDDSFFSSLGISSHAYTSYMVHVYLGTNYGVDEQGIWCCGASGGETGVYVYLKADGNLCSTFGAWNLHCIEEPLLENNEYVIVGACGAESGTHKLWVNGEYIGSATAGATLDFPSSDQDMRIGTVFGNTSFADSWNGAIYSWFHWPVQLTDAEAQSLSKDPYRFLIPA